MQHESITNTRKARMKKVVVATLVLVVMFTLFAAEFARGSSSAPATFRSSASSF